MVSMAALCSAIDLEIPMPIRVFEVLKNQIYDIYGDSATYPI
jgi:hypothetical protein